MEFEKNLDDTKQIESIIEGLLFACGERVSLDKLSKILNLEKQKAKTIITNMTYHYNNSSRGIMIREINNGYQLCTKPEIYEFIKVAFEPKKNQGLSSASYETLSIIAYNGPITKSKIEKIRGVNSDNAVSKLLERSLIKEAGCLDAPGKPILYDVSEEFFRKFGISSKAGLPSLEVSEIVEQSTVPNFINQS
jgi:segregation and condensation protein B